MSNNQQQTKQKKNWQEYIPLAILICLPFIMIVVFAGGRSANAGPNPLGSQIPIPQELNDPAVQSLQDKLAYFTDSKKFINANSEELTQLKALIVVVRDGVKAKKTGFTSFSVETADQLDILLKDIDDLQVSPSITPLDVAHKKEIAETIVKKIKSLNLVALGAINCGGGHCLDVPIVTQGENGYCARTSLAMAQLYYAKGDLSKRFFSGYVKLVGGIPSTEGSGGNVVSAGTLNSTTPLRDWTDGFRPTSSDEYYNAIKKSLLGGDPVVLYTVGAFYSPSSIHVVIAVGYNDDNKTIYINNPQTTANGGTKKATNRTYGGRLLTADWLYQHNGLDHYGHEMLIRSSHLK